MLELLVLMVASVVGSGIGLGLYNGLMILLGSKSRFGPYQKKADR